MKLNRISRRLFVLLLFLLGCAPFAQAATITWTNTVGGLWFNATNWSPNQVPGTNDDAYITNAGTYSVTGVDANSMVNSLTIGGAGSGVQTLQAGPPLVATTLNINTGGVLSAGTLYATSANINTGGLLVSSSTLYVTNAIINNGGSLEVDSTLYGAATIGNGGILRAGHSFGGSIVTFAAQVTVNSGGELVGRLGSCLIGEESQAAATSWLTVQSGGLVTLLVTDLHCLSPLTNAGTIHLTNAYVTLDKYLTEPPGGIVNQPGGIINLWLNSSFNKGIYQEGYLINQGTMNFASGSGQISLHNFDLSQGTITTQPGFGTLQVGTFSGLGSFLGTYNAAAGTTIQVLAVTNAPVGYEVSAGTPLALGGAGRYEFFGDLLLPLNPVPGLEMAGGKLYLGAGFQGGSITNLSLNGMAPYPSLILIPGLVNTITGTLAATNSILGPLTVTNGGQLLMVNGRVSGSPLTVSSGGELVALGSGGYVNPLIVQSGGSVALAASNLACLWPITNAGTINLTNSSLLFYDPSNPGLLLNGSLVNQAGGAVNLWQGSGLFGRGQGEYLINAGTIDSSDATTMYSFLTLSNIYNQGLISVEHGTLVLQCTNLNLQPSGTLRVGMTSLSDYGNFSISNGTAPLGGTFAVALNDGYVPSVGSMFPVLSYGSFSGNFNGFSYTPADIVWQPSYGSTSLNLVVQPAIAISGASLTLNVNGAPGHQAVALTSTDLALPRNAWTPMATNTFDATGFLSFTSSVNPAVPRAFFTFGLP